MFPGGLQEMNSYIGKSINYPLKAKNERIEGLINVKFTIDQNGNAINPVIVTGIGGGCDEEVIRIINMMPKWSPASLNGKVVSVEYTIPVKFQLQEEQNTKTKNEVIFTAVAEQPKFPGGTDAMYNYIGKNLIYPTEAIESSVEGRVFANFIVDKEGKIRDVNILKGIGHGCDEAAKQVLIHMPTWIAGRQNGKPVNVYVTMPIVFKLTNEKRNNSSQKVRSILEKEKNLDEYSDNQ
jgi:TonB family protein